MTNIRVKTERKPLNLCECGCYYLLVLLQQIHNEIEDIKKVYRESLEKTDEKCDECTWKDETTKLSRCDDCDERFDPDNTIVPLDWYAPKLKEYYVNAFHLVVPALERHLFAQYEHNRKLEHCRNNPADNTPSPDPMSNISEVNLDETDTKCRSKFVDLHPKKEYDNFDQAWKFAQRERKEDKVDVTDEELESITNL